jgi:hypothetical protein
VSNAEEYRRQAAKCVLVAEDCQTSTSRLALMEMAQSWLLLAGQADKNSHLDLVYESPPAQTLKSA